MATACADTKADARPAYLNEISRHDSTPRRRPRASRRRGSIGLVLRDSLRRRLDSPSESPFRLTVPGVLNPQVRRGALPPPSLSTGGAGGLSLSHQTNHTFHHLLPHSSLSLLAPLLRLPALPTTLRIPVTSSGDAARLHFDRHTYYFQNQRRIKSPDPVKFPEHWLPLALPYVLETFSASRASFVAIVIPSPLAPVAFQLIANPRRSLPG